MAYRKAIYPNPKTGEGCAKYSKRCAEQHHARSTGHYVYVGIFHAFCHGCTFRVSRYGGEVWIREGGDLKTD